jgi:glycosyltransferase involved in cell wall biosynthesis
MKILWIVNTIFPAPSIAIGLNPPVVGGWMYGLAKQLSENEGISLAVATTYSGREIKSLKLDNIEYYLLPSKHNSMYVRNLENKWESICSEFKPDLIHIHGTELAHGLACMRKLPNLNYVVSIQGLISVIERYYYVGISKAYIIKNITFRDIVRWDTIFQQKKKFYKRGILEKEYIKRSENVIGRTSWDYAHTKVINPNVTYHFCNETLRDGFYTADKWSFDNCIPHTIFLSQASYPIKGLHQVIKSLVILKNKYPNIKVRVGGANIIKASTLSERLRLSGYGKYIKRLIKENSLEKNIEFLGSLTEKEMIREYLNSNVFICPSSIENSPNSVGEAQLLGVPVISSYVGGVEDMIENGKTGFLYRFEEVEMLAILIDKVFTMQEDQLAILSKNEAEVALRRHNPEVNVRRMIEIYNNAYNNNN